MANNTPLVINAPVLDVISVFTKPTHWKLVPLLESAGNPTRLAAPTQYVNVFIPIYLCFV